MCKHIHKVHSLRIRDYATGRSHEVQNEKQYSEEGITIYNTEVHKAERQQMCEDRIKERAVVALRQIESHLENLKVTGLSRVCTTP